MRMRAWYDILSVDLPRGEDGAGIRDSDRLIQGLIQRENGRGIPTDRILLAGFSQGGAMALHTGLRYPEKLAGILALSCYVPLASTLAGEHHPVNRDTPIFIAHGQFDPVIPVHYGKASLAQLQSLGYRPQWHEYPMGHEVSWEQIQDIGRWISSAFSDPAQGG
jgi:phospholipase/carboxylesterase